MGVKEKSLAENDGCHMVSLTTWGKLALSATPRRTAANTETTQKLQTTKSVVSAHSCVAPLRSEVGLHRIEVDLWVDDVGFHCSTRVQVQQPASQGVHCIHRSDPTTYNNTDIGLGV